DYYCVIWHSSAHAFF
nr:immunoglobulin light chain junction region [Macaca mulatta]MOX80057.1 immunoglobulin light chain junction region [Macaca mulatta]